jgi:ribosomal protein S18 acetylase RimI-like enzyme
MSQTLKHIPPHIPPGPACTVRKADLGDTADTVLLTDLLDLYARELLDDERGLPEARAQDAVRGLRTMPGTLALFAYLAKEPVGMAICLMSYSTFRAAPVLNVHDLMVRAEFRGRGVANELLRRAEREAENRGCCKVTLEVREDNQRARRLYHRRGYTGAPGSDTSPGTFFLEFLV